MPSRKEITQPGHIRRKIARDRRTVWAVASSCWNQKCSVSYSPIWGTKTFREIPKMSAEVMWWGCSWSSRQPNTENSPYLQWHMKMHFVAGPNNAVERHRIALPQSIRLSQCDGLNSWVKILYGCNLRLMCKIRLTIRLEEWLKLWLKRYSYVLLQIWDVRLVFVGIVDLVVLKFRICIYTEVSAKCSLRSYYRFFAFERRLNDSAMLVCPCISFTFIRYEFQHVLVLYLKLLWNRTFLWGGTYIYLFLFTKLDYNQFQDYIIKYATWLVLPIELNFTCWWNQFTKIQMNLNNYKTGTLAFLKQVHWNKEKIIIIYHISKTIISM